MRNYLIFAAVITSLFLAGCAGSGGNTDLSIKIEGAESNLAPKSTWSYHSTKTFSYPENGKTVMSKSSTTSLVIANFELDTSQAFISLGKQKIDSADKVKIMFSLTGDKGSSVDQPLKTGEYKAESDKFNAVDNVTIYHFVDGKEKKTFFSSFKSKGTVNVTAVGETITGTIDVSDEKNSIKGGFSVKTYKKS